MAESRRIALIITNSEYDDSRLAGLTTPGADGTGLADILKEPEICGFDEVELLQNSNSGIVRLAIANFYRNRKRDDLLLLYFSGHGVLDNDRQLYLAVKDTSSDSALINANGISAAYVNRLIDNCRSRRQIVMLDCCHSGAFARGSKATNSHRINTGDAFDHNGYGTYVITATDTLQYAWEGDKLEGKYERSLFTHHVVEGLRTGQADIDRSGQITIEDLYQYVHDRVRDDGDGVRKQTPTRWINNEVGSLVIARNPSLIKAPPPPQFKGEISLAEMRQLMLTHLEAEDLKDIAFDLLNIPERLLRGSVPAQVRQVLMNLNEREKLPDLMGWLWKNKRDLCVVLFGKKGAVWISNHPIRTPEQRLNWRVWVGWSGAALLAFIVGAIIFNNLFPFDWPPWSIGLLSSSPTPTTELTSTVTITPSATSCVPPDGWVSYTLQPGDTLGSIAQRIDITVEELSRFNCLSDANDVSGQEIFVPHIPNRLTLTKPTVTFTPLSPTETDLPPTSTNTLTVVPPTETPTNEPSPTAQPNTPTSAPELTATRTMPPTATNTLTLTPTPTYTPTPTLIEPESINDHIWIEIPAGPFMMGAAGGDSDAPEDESPLHEVTLDTFWIARHETTNGQYKVFIDAGNDEHIPDTKCGIWKRKFLIGPLSYKEDLVDHPVVCVSWYDALAYAEWLAEESGLEVTLPSEAEWEKAARGDQDSRIYPWGNNFDGTLLNYCDSNCDRDWADGDVNDGFERTAPVGSYPDGASPYGVENMAGNVLELTRSTQEDYPYVLFSSRENLTADVWRVLRGGSWYDDSRDARVSARVDLPPDHRHDSFGFRVAVVSSSISE